MNRRDLLKGTASLYGSAVLSQCRASSDSGISLLAPGRSALVVASREHLPSAHLFNAAFHDLTGQHLEIAAGEPEASERPLIVIGDVSMAVKK